MIFQYFIFFLKKNVILKRNGDHYTLVTSLTGHLLGIPSMSSSKNGAGIYNTNFIKKKYFLN